MPTDPAARHGVRAPTRPPVALTAAAFVSSFDRFVVGPVIVLIADDLGVSFAAAIWVASGYYLAYGLCQPLWGVLSDRYGRVPLIRIALVLAAVAGVASVLAGGFGALLAARLCAGACFGAVVPTTLTYVGDTVSGAHRQGALSDLMGAMAVATATATATGGLLAAALGWRTVFVASSVAALACVVAMRDVREPSREPMAGLVGHLGRAVTDRRCLLVYGLVFVEGALLLGSLTLLAPALQAQGMGAGPAGLATAAYGVGTLTFSRVVRPLSRRRPIEHLMAIGGVAMALGCALVAVTVSLASVVTAALLFGCGWAFLHTSLQTWATRVLPAARGTVVSLFAASLFLGSAASTAVAGPIAQAGYWSFIFAGGAVAALPLTLACIRGHRRQGRQDRQDLD